MWQPQCGSHLQLVNACICNSKSYHNQIKPWFHSLAVSVGQIIPKKVSMTLRQLTNDKMDIGHDDEESCSQGWWWVLPAAADPPPVQLRADELHLNSLGPAQRYISLAHNIFPVLYYFYFKHHILFYILATYYNFIFGNALQFPSSWVTMCNRVCAFGLASICTAAKRHTWLLFAG